MVANSAPTGRSAWAIFRRVWSEIEGHRVGLSIVLALGVIAAPLGLLQPLALKVVIDNYLAERPLPSWVTAFIPEGVLGLEDRLGYLILAVAMVILVAVLNQTIGFARRLLRVTTKERLALDFRMRLFGHIERLSLTYHDQQGTSESTFRVLLDTAVVPGVILDGVLPIVQATALLAVISTVIIVMSPKLALLAVIVAPVLFLVSWPFGKRLRSEWHAVKEIDTTIMGRLQEVFSAVRVIKTFGREQNETDRLRELAEKSVAAKIKVTVTQSWFTALTAIGIALGMGTFLFFGGQMVRSGEIRLGDLVLIAALMIQFYSPLQLLVGQVGAIQGALASAERVLRLLDRVPEVVERPDALSMNRALGAVTFEDVRFAYEPGVLVLKGIDIAITPGERIGIAGHTGSGKTTLMNLLTRLYDPSEGRVLIDGVDLRDLKLDDLRNQFAVVLQEPVLFRTTVTENIRYGAPGATEEQVRQAAHLANAHDFIMSTEQGYETVVGERGQRFSGGERQRIALARAFLKDAPLLILDEPTSSVDMQTEEAIIQALLRLMEGRTVFIIAHRPSTLAFCDKVLVLDHGQVAAFAAPDAVTSLTELMLTKTADAP